MSTKYKMTPVYDEASYNAIQDAACSALVVLGGVAAFMNAGVTDSSETLVFARQLETIKNTVYNVQYAELKGRQFVPFSSEGGAESEYITYRVWDRMTMARLVADYQTDFELVTASASEFTMKYHDFGNAYGFSITDLRRAAKAGVGLDAMYAKFAREGHELAIDDAVAIGVPQVKTYGLTNHPNVSLATLPNGTWASATAEDILEDLNYLVDEMFATTLEIHKPNTVLMSTRAYQLIAKKILNAAGSTKTVLETFKEQNPGITVGSWTKLATANAAGTNGRIVAYKKDPMVLEFEMGQEFEVFPAEQSGLMFKHACKSRWAGVAVHQPAAITYADNQTL